MSRSYSQQEILNYLDECVTRPGVFFMDLGHGYFSTANSRLSLFASNDSWAIVFEKSGFANRAYSIQLELNYFGNCLQNLKPCGEDAGHYWNSQYFDLVDGDALAEIDADFEELSPSATHIQLRGKQVEIPVDKESYPEWIPDILTREYPETISFEDVARYLAFQYEVECRATMDELRTCLPDESSLPLIGHIDQWHHREYHNYAGGNEPSGERPSSYETFPLIADVLVSGDMARFQPTEEPTNHWRHWPDAGSL